MPTTQVTRLHELQVGDRSELDRLLDDSIVGHIGYRVDEHPVVIPTSIARLGDEVLAHGSTGSGWMRSVAHGVPVCLAVTSLDGVVVARSAFESTLRYRSAVIFGQFRRLEGDEKAQALDVMVDRLIPGRAQEIRRPSLRELARTMVLSLPLITWSLKVSQGWPEDTEDDIAGSAWAGVVPLAVTSGSAVPAPDLRADIPVPPSVVALSGVPQH